MTSNNEARTCDEVALVSQVDAAKEGGAARARAVAASSRIGANEV